MTHSRATIPVATLALASRQARHSSEHIGADPIAIVGMACRFPAGGDSSAAFWRLLQAGTDAIREVPVTRWNVARYYDPEPTRPGTISTRWGSFLEGVDLFDAAFFGITAREAAEMDPQQRLLLEVAYEAFEDAGQTAEALRGARAGVFFAIYNTDYLQGLHANRREITAYTTSGTVPCMAAGRVSYQFDLRGPSLVVDTACSSSLVALHQACESLRAGTSDLAVTGGVSLVLAPERTISLTKWGFMAPDGRCKPFDARANGWVRGEGCGVVVLRRLTDALAAGDRILAVIRGTAINQDGRSTVLTAPNGTAQVDVIRAALRDGRVSPDDIGYIEAHGTGTTVGDPIEFEALDEALGQGAEGRPILVGAVKANLGHLEAAAGIAGLIKTVLVLANRHVPPQIHFSALNPLLSFERSRLRIAPQGAPWPDATRRRFAGVSAFGFSGTNAHAVLEEAPELPPVTVPPNVAHLLTLSARSPLSLERLARKYMAALGIDGALADAPLSAICYTAGVKRDQHEHRLTIAGLTRDDLIGGLELHLAGSTQWNVACAYAHGDVAKGVVFVFSGQGAQWAGMGRVLLESEPAAREAFDECARIVAALGGPALHDAIGGASSLSSTSLAQPAIFALQVAVVAQLAAWGIRPAAVVGHSVGEIAAAYVAGALTLEQAATIVIERSRRMESAAGRGRMLAAGLSHSNAEAWLGQFDGSVSIAAMNASSSVVLSGDVTALADCQARLINQGISCQPLETEYAFHSRQMVEACAGLGAALRNLTATQSHTPFVSTVSGTLMSGALLDGAYWERNAVAPVAFQVALSNLVREGHRRFLEIGPHPVLIGYVASALDGTAESLAIGTLHKRRDDRIALRAAAGALHAHGVAVDLRRLLPRDRIVSLPSYAWDGQRYWAPAFDAAQRPDDENATRGTTVCPLQVREIASPWTDRRVFETVVSATRPAYLHDHRIQDQVLLPATVFLTIAADVAARLSNGPVTIDDVFVHAPLPLGDEDVTLQVGVRPCDSRGHTFEIVSRNIESRTWTMHASGAIRSDTTAPHEPLATESTDAVRISIAGDEFYDSLESTGVDFGPAFRSVQCVSVADGHGHAQIALPTPPERRAEPGVSPVLLDGCLQSAWAVAARRGALPTSALVPVAFGCVRLSADTQSTRLAVHLSAVKPLGDGAWTVDFVAHDGDGHVVAVVERAMLRPFPDSATSTDTRHVDQVPLLEPEWVETALDPRTPTSPEAWLLLADSGGIGRQLAQHLQELGHSCWLIAARPGTSAERLRIVDPRQASGVKALLSDFANATSGPRHVVYLWSLDVESSRPGDVPLDERALEETAAGVLHVAQAIGRLPGAYADVTLVTRAAQPVERFADTNPPQALVWGVGRAADLELSEVIWKRVDLPPAIDAPGNVMAAALFASAETRELAWRANRWWTPRLRRADPSPPRPVTLEIGERGSFDRLHLVAREPEAPGSGDLQLRVTASGLNFRDVLNTLGMYPGEAGALGNECVGVITAVGPDVSDLAPGDAVVALGTSCLSTFVTTKRALVAKRPEALSDLDAATVPIAFLTADYALVDVAKLRPGERVLIHAAAGGVGMAAVQLARRLGAEVYATAGSNEKREYVRALGAAHVADSRNVNFADEIRRATGGQGVDVVLNSLTGPFITASLDLLAPNGRFVEIGKKGIWDADAVRTRRSDVTYSVLFLGEVIQQSPREVGERLSVLLNRCTTGELQPLPSRVFEFDRAAAAFRFMARARHIGKVILVPDRAPAWPVRPNAAYLVTGGAGAMGLHAAQWLIARGARHVVLAGRSDPREPAALESLRTHAIVEYVRCDVASNYDVDRLIGSFGKSRPPLRGIVHAAGALHDGMLVRQSWREFRRGLDAKVTGTWNLHIATRRLPLDFFVMYSSLAATLGSRGQASYCAGNAFADSCAALRRAEGLPATSVGWGAWEPGGMSGGLSAADRARWQAEGFQALSAPDGDSVLESVRAGDASHVIAVRVDWNTFVAQHPERQSLLSALAPRRMHPKGPSTDVNDEKTALVLQKIAPLESAQRRRVLIDYLRSHLVELVGLPHDRRTDEHTGFREVGLDSLLAVELRNTLQRELHVTLPATVAFDFPTLATLADQLLLTLGFDPLSDSQDLTAESPAPPIEEDAASLSEEEAAALLERELDALGRALGPN